MNILQVISHYVPSYRFGGPLQVAHSLAKELVNCGHDVIVCTTNMEDRDKNLLVPLDQPLDVDGVTVFYEPVPMFRRWGFSPSLGSRVKQLMVNADFVLIHNYFQYSGWIAASHARRLGKPITFSQTALNTLNKVK